MVSRARYYLAVGLTLIVPTTLALMHSARLLDVPAFVDAAMLVFAATGFCITANSLYWMDAEPRLALLPNARGIPAPPAARHISERARHCILHRLVRR